MMTTKGDIAAYRAELARELAKRRCACGARATVFEVGFAPVVELGITLKRGVKERNLCLRCAGFTKERVA